MHLPLSYGLAHLFPPKSYFSYYANGYHGYYANGYLLCMYFTKIGFIMM